MFARSWLWRWARFGGAAVLLLAGLLAPPATTPAFAQTITVTSTAEAPGAVGDCTLGEAIQASNSGLSVDGCPAGSGHDTIVLASGATYTLTTSVSTASAMQVLSAITIQGHGATLAHDPLVGPLRFFTMTNSSSLTLINLSLVGGLAQGADGANGTSSVDSGDTGQNGLGGAIFSAGGDVILDGATFQNNVASGGKGGTGFAGSNSSYGGTGGDGIGGALYILGTLLVQGAGAHFAHNQALGGQGGDGGTILTNAGGGGAAYGGATYSFFLDTSSGVVSADHNLARGGMGGTGASLGLGGKGTGGALYAEFRAFLVAPLVSANRAEGGHAGDFLTSNPATTGGKARGGGIYAEVLTLVGGQVMSNTAQGGGGPTGGMGRAVVYFSMLNTCPTRCAAHRS